MNVARFKHHSRFICRQGLKDERPRGDASPFLVGLGMIRLYFISHLKKSVADGDLTRGSLPEANATLAVPSAAFIPRLQSVRALAALTVSAYHAIKIFNYQGSEAYWMRAVTNVIYGPGAVFVFFILSGFVLGLALSKKNPKDWRVHQSFIARRFFRLFPALLFSSLIYYFYFNWFYEPHDFGSITGSIQKKEYFFLGELARNISLLSISLNPVTWSLQVEALFSLMISVIYFSISRSSALNLLIFALLIAVHLISRKALELDPLSVPWAYLFMCYAGWMLALFRNHVSKFISGLPPYVLYPLMAMSVLVCSTTPHFGNHLEVFTFPAAFLIAAVAFNATPRLFAFLDNGALISLGGFSYSFYLLHPLFLFITASFLFLSIPAENIIPHMSFYAFVLFVISVAITLSFSYVFSLFFERPFSSVGRKSGDGKYL